MKRKTYLASAAALALLVAAPVTATHQSHGLRGSFSGQGVSGQNYVAKISTPNSKGLTVISAKAEFFLRVKSIVAEIIFFAGQSYAQLSSC